MSGTDITYISEWRKGAGFQPLEAALFVRYLLLEELVGDEGGGDKDGGGEEVHVDPDQILKGDQQQTHALNRRQ